MENNISAYVGLTMLKNALNQLRKKTDAITKVDSMLSKLISFFTENKDKIIVTIQNA